MKRALLFLLLLTSCNSCPEKVPPFTKQEFLGRDRRPVYQAKVPQGWVRLDSAGPVIDTTKPIVSFKIEEALLVTVHSFPTDSLEERILPTAQVQRWHRQVDHVQAVIERVGHSGFTGLSFEAPGVIAWSLQLDMEHYQSLCFHAHTPEEEAHFKQMRSDYTIKATGPEELIEKHREALLFFAKSFELIQEIPSRL